MDASTINSFIRNVALGIFGRSEMYRIDRTYFLKKNNFFLYMVISYIVLIIFYFKKWNMGSIRSEYLPELHEKGPSVISVFSVELVCRVRVISLYCRSY